ncbi:hypothetical protein DFH06DRAFT_1267328 [Mycena polygramma]|nr:hypothetical protein DFH06DRAFT_1267328 [Mycena polygramma]
MDVSLEVYRNIVRSVGRRRDIAALCGVNRAFRNAAERALYNTLTVSDDDRRLCATLAESPRIAALVVALTVQTRRRDHDHGEQKDQEDHEDHDDDAEESDSESGGSQTSSGASASSRNSGGRGAPALPALDDYWLAVAGALRNTTRLRHLTIDIADPNDSANAWVLAGCVAQLHTFYCDFDWDLALCSFLATQSALHDLALQDYRELTVSSDDHPARTDSQQMTASPTHTLESTIPLVMPDTTAPDTQLQPPPLPMLTILECTFSEAAVALIPGRPLSRLKTCFSRSDTAGKRAELTALIGALRRSTAPICALDIADAAYTESGTMELLNRVAHTPATAHALRYLGTLVLPVGGRKRLQFYGLLMRFGALRCLELDVSAWTPLPSLPAAFRALAAELRLYCPAVDTVAFVHEFDRTVVSTTATGVLQLDQDASVELLWREI